MTPLLWPVWGAATRSSFSTTSKRFPGKRRKNSRAVASPTIPAPMMRRSAWRSAIEPCEWVDRRLYVACKWPCCDDEHNPAFSRSVGFYSWQSFQRRIMRVLITGGAGFLGSHLCDAMLAQGHSLVCADNLLTGRMENLTHLAHASQFEFVHQDVCESFDRSEERRVGKE